jgi:predicted CXXCH cytochrome family protein
MPREYQWIVLLALLLAGLMPLAWRLRSRPVLAFGVVLFLALGTLFGAWAWDARLTQGESAYATRLAAAPRVEHPGGYVTSDACRSCHPGEYASWHQSYHRTMTTLPSPETVKATEIPVTLELAGVTYRIERRGDEYWVELPDPDWGVPRTSDGSSLTGASAAGSTSGSGLGALSNSPTSFPTVPAAADPLNASDGESHAEEGNALEEVPRVWRRLSLVTGSHHMQVYWVASERGNLQVAFPFVWLIAEERWLPACDSFLRDPEKELAHQFWNVSCIRCHATAGVPRPDAGYIDFDTRVGELGIACEACHGPADRHIAHHRSPWGRYLAHRQSEQGEGDDTIVNPARLAKRESAHACGQCHGILWTPTPQIYDHQGASFQPGDDLTRSTPVIQPSRLDLQPFLREPLRRQPEFLDERYWSDGEVRVAGREFNGLLDSPCYERGEMTCLSCHSMHGYQEPADMLGLRRDGNEACFQCHSEYRDRIEQHTHHPAASSGSLCYNCHMPHTTYGLLKAIRTHRVSTPQVTTALETGRPNACNLCHLDQTLDWTAGYLAQWYGQERPELDDDQTQLSAAVLAGLRGDAGQRALIAWHLGWESAQEASGTDWMPPLLGQMLEDPYAAVRFIGRRSLRTLPEFKDFTFDSSGPSETWPEARESVWRQWEQTAPRDIAEKRARALLLTPMGERNTLDWDRLLKQRDHRSMDLQE